MRETRRKKLPSLFRPPDTLDGGDGADVHNGGDGDDTFEAGTTADYGDTLNGGNGFDTADYSERTNALNLYLNYLNDDGEAAEGDYLFPDIERLVAGSGNDTIKGNIGANTLEGGDGNDVIWGDDPAYTGVNDGAADVIDAGPGNDDCYGGPGNDTITGREGNDDLYGQGGDDRFFVQGDFFADYVDGGGHDGVGDTSDRDTGGVTDILVNVENVV